MPNKIIFNAISGEFDYINTDVILKRVTSDPATGTEGEMILNTTDDAIKVYYGSSWQTIHSLTPGTDSYLLLESGDKVLLESGDKIILEG